MNDEEKVPAIPVIIYGAGEAGALVVEGLKKIRSPRLHPVAFIDDNDSKVGIHHAGLPVETARGRIRPILHTYQAEKVLIAIPSASGRRIREIHIKLVQESIPTLIVPGLSTIVSSSAPITTFRSVHPEDFLRRHPRVLEKGHVTQFLKDKRVLVTGAGGTIGTELVSQLMEYDLAAIGCIDRSELAVYHLQDLLNKHPRKHSIPSHVFLSDTSRMDDVQSVWDRFSPNIIFHAAAYKHVCILEQEVQAAIINNICSTTNLVHMATESKIETFVHISTDKAIQPTSVMGATKRIGEIIVQSAQERVQQGKYISVRFGNVLGSSGSVFHKFIDQINQGVPVTISHPEARRYFMLTSEAIELVLQSGAIGRGGKIYILDIGEPILIINLAEDLIRYFGKQPGIDVPFLFTGLGPGEKLVEDLSHIPTQKIDEYLLEAITQPSPVQEVDSLVRKLISNARAPDAALDLIRQLAPDYHPSTAKQR